MNKFNDVAAVTVSLFNQGTVDKNGHQPVILTVIAGKLPNKIVIAGTVAQSVGFEVNNTYLVNCSEGEPDPTYGRQFNYKILGKLSPMDILAVRKELGSGSIFDVIKSREDLEIVSKTDSKGKSKKSEPVFTDEELM